MSSTRSDPPTMSYFSNVPSANQASGASTGTNSPTELNGSSSVRSPFGMPSMTKSVSGIARSGAGSPSHELGSGAARLYSKRAREIQAQEGVQAVPLNVWGPPTSGNSTPLRENIPESPTDSFPDYVQLPTPESAPQSQSRRARAGTVPSRFAPGAPVGTLGLVPDLNSRTSRPTPSPSPFKSPSPTIGGELDMSSLRMNSDSVGLLSRLRSGSMPHRNFLGAVGAGASSPFGPSIFSSSYAQGRARTSTLQSIASVGSNNASSPSQSAFSREGATDKNNTLDYLGLADNAPLPPSGLGGVAGLIANMENYRRDQRWRSMSVNTGDHYPEDEDGYVSGAVTPYDYQQQVIISQLNATNAAIEQHNRAVQDFVKRTARPRASTAGVLDSPRVNRNFLSPGASRLDNITSASELMETQSFDELSEAVQTMGLGTSTPGIENNRLNPTDQQFLEEPTSSLWLGNIPPSTTPSTLTEMFKQHGPVASARVLTHKNCGFVNFEHVESAQTAKALLNGKEIFPGAGPVRINFAKPASATGTPGHSPSPDPFSKGQEAGAPIQARSSEAASGGGPGIISRPTTTPPIVPELSTMKKDILEIVKFFGATEEDQMRIGESVERAITYNNFTDDIPPVKEATSNRIFDAPKLRDVRKRIDNATMTQAEMEIDAMKMLPEIAELASDYLGNTVVQKLFELCSGEVKDAMLREIGPHMAEIGVHKNGTWAAQKIIDHAKTHTQKSMIVENLHSYTVPLFLDQFGNYVLQGCLGFKEPYTSFIFETMLSQMWKIAQGRFGARAMRACLESHYSSKDQQRMLAAAIALHSVQLATNANGALLLTWFLDTCTLPQRRTVLAPRLVPHLVHLCTHKLAYLTVLKIINQKNELGARDTILNAMFFSMDDQVLEDILKDHQCGATLIFKVLTTPFFNEEIRPAVVENIKKILLKLKAQPQQGYKRLMDEVGLSTRNGTSGPSRDHSSHNHERQRPASQHSSVNNHAAPPQQYANQFYNQLQQSPYDPGMAMGMQRTDSFDSNTSAAYPPYVQNGMFAPPQMQLPLNMQQQVQYQQSMAMAARASTPVNNFYGGMNTGFSGYGSLTPSMDPYRNQGLVNGSPIQAPQMGSPMMAQNGFAPQAFGMGMGAGMGGYGFPGMGGMQNMAYMPQEQVNGRRGRQL